MESSHSLNTAFNPSAVAVVGASDRAASRGTYIWNGVMNSRRALEAYPVNPKYKYIGVTPCWPTLKELPAKIDLAVLTIPSEEVENLIKECGKLGIGNVLIAPANSKLSEDRHWRRKIVETASQLGIRIIGPDSMGIMRPRIGLNVSYWPQLAKAGVVGLVCQSGAVATALLDYAGRTGIGFSTVISTGRESDVSLAEIIDFLAADEQTSVIALHIEALRDPRAFFSAVRAAVRIKPVVVLKAGRGSNAGRITAARLGLAAFNEDIFDALLERCGAIRCDKLETFCATLEVFCCGKNPREGRLAMICSDMGFAALAVDAADAAGVKIAQLSPESDEAIRSLTVQMCPVSNPVALASDAGPEAVVKALEVCLADDNVDGVMLSLCPSAVSATNRTVQLIATAAKESFKPVIINWMTPAPGEVIREGFSKSGLPCLLTPDLAVLGFANLTNDEAMRRRKLTPASEVFAHDAPDFETAKHVVKEAQGKGEHVLPDKTCRELLAAFGIKTLASSFAQNSEQAVEAARKYGYPVAVKLVAEGVSHRTDIGGVLLNVADDEAVIKAFDTLKERVQTRAALALFKGVIVQKMVTGDGIREISIKAVTDPVLGAGICFAAGGRTGEIFPEKIVASPPISEPLARDMIRRHRLSKVFAPLRELDTADENAVVDLLLRVSRIMSEVPAVSELTLNPVRFEGETATVLDASISLSARSAEPDVDYSHMILAPSENRLSQPLKTMPECLLRNIRPSDFSAEKRMISRLSSQSAYLRFHKKAEDITDNEIVEFVDIDRTRESAFVVVDAPDEGKRIEMHAVARISLSPDSDTAEFGILVEDSCQKKGLGGELMQTIEDEARRRGAKHISGWVVRGNSGMAALLTRRGYEVRESEDDADFLIYTLSLAGGNRNK